MIRFSVHGTPLRLGALFAGAVLLAGGCSPGSDGGDGGGKDEEEQKPTYSDGPFEREGVSGMHQMFESSFRIDKVERYEDRTVLRFTTAPSGEDEELSPDAYSGGILDSGPSGIRLIDPVGRKLYYPAHDDGDLVGSELPTYVVGGVDYKMEAHFPRLPDGTERITVVFPGTQAEFTGIPVEEAEGERKVPDEEPPKYYSLNSGDEVVAPVNDGEVSDGYGWDLYSITEGTEIKRDTSATHRQVDLDADVLFEFDEAELTDEASSVLDEVVAETKEQADPDKPPITITGHTDGKGDEDYNQTLSEERAETVRDYLEAELGSEYAYETEGKGATEPVAEEGGADDEEARAQNRRVEISYNIKVAETQAEASEEKTASAGRTGDTAPPAPFREKDPEPVATGEYADDKGYSYDLELLPLYRDGAYLVARFRLTNTSDKDIRIATISGPYFSGNGLTGARFGSFGVVDPETETVYRAVRIGDDDPDEIRDYIEPPGFPYEQKPGSTNRSFLYFPAPPLDVEKVTFDAGPFGTFEDVPIEPVPGE
ncbi:OmpA family protein [Nocardiopsis sp. CNT-189]|uniref:OmpA family protein n=1 Tax=Nocardiopsis oceanisediminis TaxID=2816862 RepID=UPI003B2D51E5